MFRSFTDSKRIRTQCVLLHSELKLKSAIVPNHYCCPANSIHKTATEIILSTSKILSSECRLKTVNIFLMSRDIDILALFACENLDIQQILVRILYFCHGKDLLSEKFCFKLQTLDPIHNYVAYFAF